MSGKAKKVQGCPHPPERLYAGLVEDPFLGISVWAACCDCGELIREGYSARTLKAHTEQQVVVSQGPLFDPAP